MVEISAALSKNATLFRLVSQNTHLSIQARSVGRKTGDFCDYSFPTPSRAWLADRKRSSKMS